MDIKNGYCSGSDLPQLKPHFTKISELRITHHRRNDGGLCTVSRYIGTLDILS